nr:MAG: hypothetical protein [Lokiarchaeota virus Skoll Meg22_1214]
MIEDRIFIEEYGEGYKEGWNECIDFIITVLNNMYLNDQDFNFLASFKKSDLNF